MTNLRKIIQKSLLIMTYTIPIGCSQLKLNQYLENSPISALEYQTEQTLNNREIFEFYKRYFPNGKLELSHEEKIGKTRTRTFIRPNIRLTPELDYDISAGIETKY